MKLALQNDRNIADIFSNLGEFLIENGRVIAEYRRAMQPARCIFRYYAVFVLCLKERDEAVCPMSGLQGINPSPS